MMCSVIAQVDGIPAVAPWRHRFPDFAEAVETIRHGENLSLRLTAQVALEDQIVDALRLLQHARTALESDSAERSLQRIRKALK